MTLPVIALAIFLALIAIGVLAGSIAFPIVAYREARDGDPFGAIGTSVIAIAIWILLIILASTAASELSVGPEWLHWPEDAQ